MPNVPKVSVEEARTLSHMADLQLSEARLTQLASTLSRFMSNLERTRTVNLDDNEPPTITFDREART